MRCERVGGTVGQAKRQIESHKTERHPYPSPLPLGSGGVGEENRRGGREGAGAGAIHKRVETGVIR